MGYLPFLLLQLTVSYGQQDTISLLKQFPNSFIQRNGSNLQIEGNNVRFAGANIYWLGLDENGSPGIAYPDPFRVEDAIQTAVQTMGATVIRAHTLGISVGQKGLSFEDQLNDFTNSGIAHIDYAIYIARKYKVRLIIPLVDNWDYYHGGELTFCRWRGITNQSKFYENDQIIGDFKQYIYKLLNHVNIYTGIALKDDPTILAWSTGNELGQNVFMSPSWSNMMCKFIKNITSNQLVLNGRNGINAEELTFDCFDIYSQHYYPMDIDKLQSSAKQVFAANKVFIAGEYGWNQGGGTSLENFLNGIEESSTNIDCYWSLFPHNESYGFEYHSDGFSLYYPGNQPGDNQEDNVVFLRNHAYKMANAQIAEYPLCNTPNITNVDGTTQQRIVYWRGGAGCIDYEIQRNDNNGNPDDDNWRSEIDGVNDFDGYWNDKDGINSAQKCVWYRIRGRNYDKKYSNFSIVSSFCF